MKFGSRFDAYATIFMVLVAVVMFAGLTGIIGLAVFDDDPMGNHPTLTRLSIIAFLGGVAIYLVVAMLALVALAAAAIWDAADYLRSGDE